MKPKQIAFVAGIFALLLSCKTEEKKTEEKATIPAADYTAIFIQHPVADFEAWKPHYFDHDSVRKAYGISHYQIARGIVDTSLVVVFNKIDDTAKAREFTALPDLKAVMDKAGVTGPPTFEYLHVVRDDASAIPINERIMVKHKVKDFDEWLKVFDNEGMDARKSFGIIDRGLARGVDDPNMVYIVFAVEDWEKANARFNSEELKKLMTEAGVEGSPTIIRYNIAG